jgi:HIRAN domain
MEKSLVPIDPALLALMHGSFGKDGTLMPFVREIMLVECHIAGTSHRTLKDIEPTLAPGALLVLKRELGNPHDALAIMIFAETGHNLGYVPPGEKRSAGPFDGRRQTAFRKARSEDMAGRLVEGRGAHLPARRMTFH